LDDKKINPTVEENMYIAAEICIIFYSEGNKNKVIKEE
jgi:hypothetical protein